LETYEPQAASDLSGRRFECGKKNGTADKYTGCRFPCSTIVVDPHHYSHAPHRRAAP